MFRPTASRPPLRVTSRRSAVAVLAAVVCAAGLVGCAAPQPAPTADPTRPVPSPSSTADSEPALAPDGTAADNLPLFAAVTASVWASEERGAGRAYVDALVAAGFDKAAMQVTRDQSTVGNPAESIQFSVRWAEECLVGQVGPAIGEPVTAVVPVLAEGTCLVGETRPIDW